MAEVFLAEADDAGTPLKVALKLMREGQDAEAFAAEADLMGLLTHPNLVRRLEVGEAFGRLYIAMEALLGGDLKGVAEQVQGEGKDFPPQVAFHVVGEVLKGLSYFHQAKTRTGMPLQLVHGDVNPANVFFGLGGEVKLGDFGVATSRRAAIGPGAGIAAGKLRYLSPEQVRGEALSPGSDLFTVGVMLYELLCGQHPFVTDEQDERAALSAMRAAKLNPPDDLPRPLIALLRRALHPNPEQRFQTAGEFAGAVLHYALDHGQGFSAQELRAWVRQQAGVPG
jgi:serine/threonine-protein kinase